MPLEATSGPTRDEGSEDPHDCPVVVLVDVTQGPIREGKRATLLNIVNMYVMRTTNILHNLV
jgi:hypothetical protein